MQINWISKQNKLNR